MSLRSRDWPPTTACRPTAQPRPRSSTTPAPWRWITGSRHPRQRRLSGSHRHTDDRLCRSLRRPVRVDPIDPAAPRRPQTDRRGRRFRRLRRSQLHDRQRPCRRRRVVCCDRPAQPARAHRNPPPRVVPALPPVCIDPLDRQRVAALCIALYRAQKAKPRSVIPGARSRADSQRGSSCNAYA